MRGLSLPGATASRMPFFTKARLARISAAATGSCGVAGPRDVHCPKYGAAGLATSVSNVLRRVAPLDLDDVLKQMPLPAVEEIRRADMAER